MIIDCHYHHDLSMLKTDQLLAKMDESGVDQIVLIPCMNGEIPMPPDFMLKVMRFFLTHRRLRGLARRGATNFDKDGDLKLPLGKIKILRDPAHEAVNEAIQQHPNRFKGWVFINPHGDHDPLQEVARWLNVPGFIGVKAHPFWHQYGPEALKEVAHVAAKLNKPMLVHVGFDQNEELSALLNEVPGLKLILAHAAFPGYADTWAIIKDKPNVVVDLSAEAYVDEKITKQAIDYLGVDRCLFGTDGPYGTRAADGLYDYGLMKRRIEKMYPDPGVQRKILGENFLEFTGISTREMQAARVS